MKIILKNNVPNLGQKDDIKEVKPGFWRNFLLPQGLAVEATPQLIEQAQKSREEREKQKRTQEEKFLESIKKLKEKTLIIEAKTDEKGSLFEAIDAEKIREAVKEEFKLEIAAEEIEIEKPIKKTGSHEVLLRDIKLKVEIKKAEH